MQTIIATMENSMEIPLKTANRTAIRPSNHTVGNQNWKRLIPQCSLQLCLQYLGHASNLRCPLADEWIKKLWYIYTREYSVRFSSVTQLCPTLCNPMDCSMLGLPVHHQLPEFIQTHVHWVGDTIQPTHPLSSPSPPTFNLCQHQGLFQWVNSLHQVAEVLEFQLQH